MEKTTLTNLIETLEKEIKKNTLGGIKFYGLMEAQRLAKELLEKEKEQIIDFAYGCTQHISREDIEEYYNKTYNQKQIIHENANDFCIS